MRTFDELIRTALVDIATRAEPVDLADAALADAARRNQLLLPAVVVSAVLVFGTGLLVSFTGGGHETPGGRFQPDRDGHRPHHSAPATCATPGLTPCSAAATGTASAADAASQSPSPTASKSKEATPSPSPTTPSVDTAPGNRPRPKPSKPGRGGA